MVAAPGLAAAQNAGDAEGPAFYGVDSDIIVREGPVVRGAGAIRDWWRDYFSQPRPHRAVLVVRDKAGWPIAAVRVLPDVVDLVIRGAAR